LDLSDYQSALVGGNSGPALIPGDADNSNLIIIQSAGGHPGQFSDQELSQIYDWITEGAAEN
jgi:hypothetical protein